ncbi:MAG TPA: TatD family hydrolase [Bacillota bacterium]|nr:TatD family hydrolase [Bacillota bacterium]HRU42706.1 TatD family hydrolase [Candidatus Diapherotrites archaeon]HQE67161.1 TatD family hydrolase [Bacillota bacterium]HQI16229.1 TatD family hydrolase [Bacillota bacterium]HQJ37433.1 TatD family hydrolase [Bacillota bacterium]
MLFDTHAHLDDDRFDKDRDETIMQCQRDGVELILNAGSNIETSVKAIALAKKYEFIYAAVGVHPHDAAEMDEETAGVLAALAGNKKVRAIGEIGLDYHYDFSPRDVQKQRFVEQIDLARQLKLPVIVHDREAHGDVMDIFKKTRIKEVGGVLHSFSGSAEMALECIKLGLYISISGPVTFENARKTVEAVKQVPLDMLLIETDSPYLTPVPYRGKRNYPGYVRFVAEKIAEIKGISFEEVARQTLENGKRLFRI